MEAGLAYYVVRGSAIANNRAYAALEHACQQYPENGVYTGVVRTDTYANYFPAKVGGFYCIRRPLIPVTTDGQFYVSYLSCNGQKRDMMDVQTFCASPVLGSNK